MNKSEKSFSQLADLESEDCCKFVCKVFLLQFYLNWHQIKKNNIETLENKVKHQFGVQLK